MNFETIIQNQINELTAEIETLQAREDKFIHLSSNVHTDVDCELHKQSKRFMYGARKNKRRAMEKLELLKEMPNGCNFTHMA